jgi:hypothetical protein
MLRRSSPSTPAQMCLTDDLGSVAVVRSVVIVILQELENHAYRDVTYPAFGTLASPRRDGASRAGRIRSGVVEVARGWWAVELFEPGTHRCFLASFILAMAWLGDRLHSATR